MVAVLVAILVVVVVVVWWWRTGGDNVCSVGNGRDADVAVTVMVELAMVVVAD